MGTGKTLPETHVSQEATEQAGRVLERLQELRETKKAVTIPVYGDTDFTSEDSHIRHSQFRRLRDRITRLPPFSDDRPLSIEAVIALARELRVVPRRTPDFYVYKGSCPQATWQGQTDYWNAIHNVLPLRQSNLPRHTYWHEFEAWLSMGSLVNGIAISVNRDLRKIATNGLIAQARNKLYTEALRHFE